jgi:hypothetical protein
MWTLNSLILCKRTALRLSCIRQSGQFRFNIKHASTPAPGNQTIANLLLTQRRVSEGDSNDELQCSTLTDAWDYATYHHQCCVLQVKLSLCLTNQALRHEGVWGSGSVDPHFLDLVNSSRWVVNFTHRQLYPRERAPDTHCIGGCVKPRHGEVKILDPTGFELRPARRQSLYRLRYPGPFKALS